MISRILDFLFDSPKRLYLPDKPWLYYDTRDGSLNVDPARLIHSEGWKRQMEALKKLKAMRDEN